MKVKHLLQCHVLVEGVFAELAAGKPLPAGLERLLKFADVPLIFQGASSSWLCHINRIEKQLNWPVAPLTALADGLDPDDRYWLRADPVHLNLQRDSFTLADHAASDLTQAQADALVATLNQHFVSDGLEFLAPSPDRWYIRLPSSPALALTPLAEVIGRSIDPLLPRGQNAMQWHGWVNEAQMLLHDHPANIEREQQGQLPINSIWPWGGGALPQTRGSEFVESLGDDVLVRGIAAHLGQVAQPLPKAALPWLHAQPALGAHLLVFDQLDDPELRRNASRWQETLAWLDAAWFLPLFDALKSGKIESLHLHLADFAAVKSFTVRRRNLWKFWRRSLSLESYLHG